MESFRGSARAKQLLEKLVDYSNVPRKKPKFMNFMKNSFRAFGVNDSMLNEIWSVIESIDNKPNPSTNNNNSNANSRNGQQHKEETNGGETAKRKTIDDNETNVDAESSSSKKSKPSTADESVDEFNWFEAMKNVLAQKQDDGISLKKLEKKVI